MSTTAKPPWSTKLLQASPARFRTESTGELQDARSMDSNDLERERGITILAKNTALTSKGEWAERAYQYR